MHDIFIINYSNNYDYLLEKFPHARVIDPMDRIDMYKLVAEQSVTSHSWIVDDRYDYRDYFDFSYEPPWHQADQIHAWQSLEPKGGDTCFINNQEFLKQWYVIDSIQDYEFVCWHSRPLPALQNHPDIIIWNFSGHDENLSVLKSRFPRARVLRYFGTHLEMMKKSAAYATTPDFWVLSTCCDYENFDPAWKPAWEQEGNIHCWASGSQKFGDTFYVHKQNFVDNSHDLEKLEYFENIYWISSGYPRLPWPVNYSDFDDLYTTLKNHKFSTIYEYFVMPGSTIGSTVDPCLWEKRELIAYNRNGHVSLCPRDCISQISTKVLNYPYIQYYECKKSTETPQDIVFISYDEKDADLNYEILKKQQPHARRLHGIEGMINALKKAANESNTPWFYSVFAKTKVVDEFKFDFNPNYLDTPGNYIFHAYNQITDYTYGHGAVLLYHSKTVAEAETWGYDFTTSFPYTYIPILSCINGAETPWEAWRTSFREVLKLRSMNTVESRYRMHRWLTVGNGSVGKWSINGAQDAKKYTGSLDEANDWNWLRRYFTENYEQHQ